MYIEFNEGNTEPHEIFEGIIVVEAIKEGSWGYEEADNRAAEFVGSDKGIARRQIEQLEGKLHSAMEPDGRAEAVNIQLDDEDR